MITFPQEVKSEGKFDKIAQEVSEMRNITQDFREHPDIWRSHSMNVEIEMKEDVCVIRPQNDIDSFNVSFLKEKLKEQVDQGHYFILMDLIKVRFMDSAALGILVSGLKTCVQNSGSLGIINPSRNVENLFKITHLDSVFKVYPSENEAVCTLRKINSNI
jgi:anti-sigma B factor antagonist